jgi:outer membrane protein OmpA-like peptidoglycan-associated protein
MRTACRSFDEILLNAATRARIFEPQGLEQVARFSSNLEHLSLTALTLTMRPTVFFEFGGLALYDESIPVIDEWVRCCKEFKWLRMHISGHCGLDVYDPQFFSYRRSCFVRDYMIQRGICGGRIKVFACGNKEALSKRVGRQAIENRRAEIFTCASNGHRFPRQMLSDVARDWLPLAERTHLAAQRKTEERERRCASRVLAKLFECPQRALNRIFAFCVPEYGSQIKWE